ncbi:hypothetical protein AYK86_12995 [Acinetobacter venetianus]|uniref:DUF4435 domain-containing protein n=1 Tax=Acinetobacter venetianus TaxID=52133 RepID=UPI000775E5C3|nr:DUF4435 domain-containing protein [Acinetobacter venetianus]KXO86609.1 hypothetical protein AYK86_12995 [Acinetobacter venetianus]
MLFSRSGYGLNNIHLFYGVEVMIYIEGECSPEKYDKKFYETILNKLFFIKSERFRIEPLGGCENVKKRYDEILLNKISNSICVLDRDYSFIKQSNIYDPQLLKFSHGYSWENDFWLAKIIYRVIDFLSGGRVSKLNNFEEIISNTKKDAKKLSCYDLVSQIHAESVLDKSKASFGVKLEYDPSSTSIISSSEVKRVRGKLSLSVLSCLVSKEIYKEALDTIPEKIIQGHFWQKISLVLIVQTLKIIGVASTTVSEEIIFNIAQTIFNENINSFMDEQVKNYYLENFKIL